MLANVGSVESVPDRMRTCDPWLQLLPVKASSKPKTSSHSQTPLNSFGSCQDNIQSSVIHYLERADVPADGIPHRTVNILKLAAFHHELNCSIKHRDENNGRPLIGSADQPSL